MILMEVYQHRNVKKMLPFVILSTLSLLGILTYKFCNGLFDVFIVFEIVSLVMFGVVSRDFDKIIVLKFVSYFPLVFLNFSPELLKSYFVISYCLINIVSISTLKMKDGFLLKAPVISFALYSLLILKERYGFNIESYWTIIIFAVLTLSIMLNKYKYSKISYVLVYVLLGVSLVSLNHIEQFRFAIVILFLLHLLASFYKNFFSRVTFNNASLLMICFSLIPIMKGSLFFVILGILVLSYQNYKDYCREEVMNG